MLFEKHLTHITRAFVGGISRCISYESTQENVPLMEFFHCNNTQGKNSLMEFCHCNNTEGNIPIEVLCNAGATRFQK